MVKIKWKDTRCSGNKYIIFSFHEQTGKITAKYYGYSLFNDEEIDEKNIDIELTNCHDLMRGISQKTFRLSELNKEQKRNLLKNLKERNITIVPIYSSPIIIHAPPPV